MKFKYYVFILFFITGLANNLTAQRGPGLQWAKEQDIKIRPKAVETDSNFNSYLVGDFIDSIDFSTNSNGLYKTSRGLEDIFIEKFDFRGNLLWVQTIGGDFYDKAFDVKVD